MTDAPGQLKHGKALERMGKEARKQRAMLNTHYLILKDLVLIFQELWPNAIKHIL